MEQKILNISPEALNKVAELLLEENNPSLKLRTFVQGGGCSGFQYGFSFDEDQQEDDIIVTEHSNVHNLDISFLIDSMSIQYLNGASIDFVDDLNGMQFVIKNPNATTTCGCGSSFSV